MELKEALQFWFYIQQTFPLCFPYLCLQTSQYYVNIHLLSSGTLMISTFNLPVHLEFILIYIIRYGLDCVEHYASPLCSEVQFSPHNLPSSEYYIIKPTSIWV